MELKYYISCIILWRIHCIIHLISILSYYIITCWYFAYFVRIKFEFWYLMYIDGQWTFSKNVKFQINRITKKVMGILRQSAKLRSHQSNGFWATLYDTKWFEQFRIKHIAGCPASRNSYILAKFLLLSYFLLLFLFFNQIPTLTPFSNEDNNFGQYPRIPTNSRKFPRKFLRKFLRKFRGSFCEFLRFTRRNFE